MANIGTRPDAAQLIDAGQPRGAYGDRLFFLVDTSVMIAMLVDKDDRVLVRGDRETAEVSLDLVDPITVPYVNAFIACCNLRVEKNWRTGKYKIAVRDKAKPVGSFAVETASSGTEDDVDVLSSVLASTPPTKAQIKTALAQLAMQYRGLVELDRRLYGRDQVQPPTGEMPFIPNVTHQMLEGGKANGHKSTKRRSAAQSA